MARIARVALPDIPYHITHRGNHRADIFFSEEDREVYRALLLEYCTRYKLEIWAYCFTTNHIHLIGVGRRPDSLARGIGLAHMRYSRWINKQRGWTGHLWANRFFSTPLDDEHLWSAVRYGELNPVRAGMVNCAEEYAWSSARVHAGLTASDELLSSSRPFPGQISDWGRWLAGAGKADADRFDLLRRNTATGRPTGSPEFVRRLENELDRLLRPQRRGRKPRVAPCELTPDLFGGE